MKRAVFLVGVLDRGYIKRASPLNDTNFKLLDDIATQLKVDAKIIVAVPDGEYIGLAKKVPIKTMREYRERTLQDIRDHDPQIVVACGPLALRCLLNKGGVPLKEHQRETLEVPDLPGITCVATYSMEQIHVKPGMDKWLLMDTYSALHGLNETKWGKYTVIMPRKCSKFHMNRLTERYPNMKFTTTWNTMPKALQGKKRLGYDLETYPGLSPHHPHARIRMAVISAKVGHAWIVQAKPDGTLPNWVDDMCADPAIQKSGSNIKFDFQWMEYFGYTIENMFDTSTAEHIIDGTNPMTGLKFLAFLYTELSDYSRGHRKLVKERGGWEFVDDWEQYDYCGGDGEASIGACVQQTKKLKELKRWKPYQLFMQLYRVLAQMETDGACISMHTHKKLDKAFDKELTVIRQQLLEVLGPINPNSVPQMIDALFTAVPGINLSRTKTARQLSDQFYSLKTDKTGDEYSTEKVILEREAVKHPVVGLVLQYRRLNKLHGTYVKNLKEDHMVQHEDGGWFIHTSYHTDRVETYRLSSSQPNLQNIPRKPEPDEPNPIPPELNIKRQFVSRFAGGKIIEVDLSQAEIRVAAFLSQDKAMLEALYSGEDLHTKMASQAHQIPLSAVTALLRTQIKKTTFGNMYGAGANTLSQQLGISKKAAGKVLDDYFRTFSGLRRCIDEAHAAVVHDLFSDSIFGFRRYFRQPDSWTGWGCEGWGIKRQAWNHKVQNPAACLTYVGKIGLFNAMRKQRMDSLIFAQVHDSIVIDAHPKEWEDLCVLAKWHMENPNLKPWRVKFTVPLVADVEVGRSWGEKKKVVLA